MEQNELLSIQKLMKKIMLISVILYALLILSLFTVFDGMLSQNIRIIIIVIAPMVIAGMTWCVLKVVKGEKE